MSALIRLIINETEIPLTKGTYSEVRKSYDVLEQTEAGTFRRDMFRPTFLCALKIRMTGTEDAKAMIDNLATLSSVTAEYYDELSQTMKTWTACITDLDNSLIVEDSAHRYYDISFTLQDLEA